MAELNVLIYQEIEGSAIPRLVLDCVHEGGYVALNGALYDNGVEAAQSLLEQVEVGEAVASPKDIRLAREIVANAR